MMTKRKISSIVALFLVLILLLMVTSCGKNDTNTNNGEIKTEPIVERDNERPPTVETNESEPEESGELMSPEVKTIVEKARAIKNWHYRLDNTEFLICDEKMKIIDSSRQPAQGNTFILDTATKSLAVYRCDAGCREVNTTVRYNDIYQKTPLDYLNEESFVDATFPGYTQEINTRKATAVYAEGKDKKSIYWFDIWEKGGMLLGIDYQDLKTGATLDTVRFDILEANPKNIKDYECEIDTATA